MSPSFSALPSSSPSCTRSSDVSRQARARAFSDQRAFGTGVCLVAFRACRMPSRSLLCTCPRVLGGRGGAVSLRTTAQGSGGAADIRA